MATEARLDVVLPAGGRIEGEFAAAAGAEVKALVELGGECVLEHTLRALREVPRVGRMVVVGPEEVRSHPCSQLADAVLPEGASGPENILSGLEWLRQESAGGRADRALVVATDLPFLSRPSLEAFLEACPPEADICVPVTERREFEAHFPGLEEEYVRLRDGEWSTGCVFLVNPQYLVEGRQHFERIFRARKSQVGMGLLLGPVFVARFLLGRLSVPLIQERCCGLLRCTVRAVMPGPPELVLDLDELKDFRYAAKAAR